MTKIRTKSSFTVPEIGVGLLLIQAVG